MLGGADSLWDDVQEATRLARGPTVVAVNNAGCVWPHDLHHWATLHPKELPARIQTRERNGHPFGFLTWAPPPPKGVDQVSDCTLDGWDKGSSGLFGVGVALAISRLVILCGTPMDDRPHFDRVAGWDPDPYWDAWKDRLPEMHTRVRSMSGRTLDLLGPPTREWINSTRST